MQVYGREDFAWKAFTWEEVEDDSTLPFQVLWSVIYYHCVNAF